MEGLTIKEIAQKLGILPKAVQKRLEAAKVSPKEYAGRTAIYDPSVVEKIKDVKMGRPKKQAESKIKKARK